MENNQNEPPHIAVTYTDMFSQTSIQKVIDEIKLPNLRVAVHVRESGVMASIEWALPTAIALYVFKSYFDGFLNEAGKEHYSKLREWLKKMVLPVKETKMVTISASQSPNKVITNTQSKTISIVSQTKNGIIVKLLFDEKATSEQWERAIDKFLDYVEENHSQYPNDRLTAEIEKIQPNEKDIFVIIDLETEDLKFYNLNGLIRFYRNIE